MQLCAMTNTFRPTGRTRVVLRHVPAIGLVGVTLFLSASRALVAQRAPADILIRNGRVIDGTGVPARSADVAITGDCEATLPALTEAVMSKIPAGRRDQIAARADIFRRAHAQTFERTRAGIAEGWDAVPVST